MKNILLIGAAFRNKGAEAMAMTAVTRLGRMYPGCRVVMASYAAKEEKPYGPHELHAADGVYPFELIPNRKRLSHLLRVPLAWLLPRRLKRLALGRDRYLREFAAADMALDLSGFAMSDQRSLSRRLVYCFEILTARCLGVKFVAMTQAMGPFRSAVSRWMARRYLSKTDLLVARGVQTLNHLRHAGVKGRTEILTCADSAYLFEPADGAAAETILGAAARSEKPLLGIFPNINLYRRTRPWGADNPYVQLLARLAGFVRESLGAQPIFICHEKDALREDDLWLCRQAVEVLGSDIPIIPAEHSSAELKAVIARLDFMVSSRFHSLVAAISTATPFMALGWAHKYAELVAEAGLPDRVFDGHDLDVEPFLAAVASAWDQRAATREHLVRQGQALHASAERAYLRIAEKWPAGGAA